VLRDPAALGASIVLVLFATVTMLDSVHFRRALQAAPGSPPGAQTFYAPTTESLLDLALARQIATRETAYSQPLAYKAFIKEPMERNGQAVRDFAG
jgi:peptide/nickel transport system permease protein